MERVDGYGMEEGVGNGVVNGHYFCQSLVDSDVWKQAAYSFIIDPLPASQTVESSRGELKVMVNKGVNGEKKREKGDELELCQLGCWAHLLFLQKCPKCIASNGIVAIETVGGKGI